MKEKPILFSAPMVRAILDGRKRQTRRIMNPQPREGPVSAWSRCPYGVEGDRLWVKEAIEVMPIAFGSVVRSQFSADGTLTKADAWPWKLRKLPGMFMPKGLCRLRLAITGVRIERLQAITEEDAAAEGVDPMVVLPGDVVSHVSGFAMLWDAINHDRAPWDSNPWVWVVSFKLPPASTSIGTWVA